MLLLESLQREYYAGAYDSAVRFVRASRQQSDSFRAKRQRSLPESRLGISGDSTLSH